ncbi:PREDICTED: aldehyde dehydrogenase, dimeric NADP-preferring-like [Nicrophorus vespilloides]|uniref:Aldehyde dehydrogenase n=1 Tax=Nicrophorus vespilloides TaxID=110193 RepID=A0ABM1N5I7_NICVS|nr:PREDICTED: aldehyde dehydrogenase, dimeric NADP-preferring-like [Nicrophorus vespilloides]XP_017782088.1 PREDICTED: aldehyde dehydrogenase, dimeric NADP-preferring-like [Nicrophorus vespilloides]XP_017782089.1 PREDICTED: aldehyde dehydrogenase, dimeric NADP-preferring-like [Nicrophorus vespilloides]
MNEKVTKARAAYMAGKTRPLWFRKQQLKSLMRMYEENMEEICTAIYKDLRKCRTEVMAMEIKLAMNDVKDMLANMDKWAGTETPARSFLNWLDSTYILKDPYGVVLIVGAWNYPIQLLMVPVAGAIAAGNCVIIKPSELAPATAEFLEKTIPKYLNNDCYCVINGGIPETTKLLQEKFDYIFYTGSSQVGKIIHRAANENLTPVTLELGGKSPVYIDKTVDMDLAVTRLLWGKFVNMGQTCIAPDFVLCTPEVEREILARAPKIIEKFYGKNPQDSPDLSRMVNERHFKRVANLLQSGKVAYGGHMDAKDKYISPTILTQIKASDPVMQEEIFGPVLPIVNVNSLDEAIDYINSMEKPLALYIFSKSESTVWRMMECTSSGSVCVNDTIMQIVADNLPFGGVGNSGMGKYHGRETFDTFTHKKSCLYKNFNSIGEALSSCRYPPYSQKKLGTLLKLIDRRPDLPSMGFLRYVAAFGLGFLASIYYQQHTQH